MPQTPYGVPYPDATEPVAEGAARIQDVAEALDERVLAGHLDWGPAGVATDTTLYRFGVGILRSTGQLWAADAFKANHGDPSEVMVGLNPGGARAAEIIFGSAGDTRLYRTAAGQLTTAGLTSSYLYVDAGDPAAQVFIDGGAIWFGAPPDTSFYRVAAGVLASGGDFASRYGAAEQVYIGGDGAGRAAIRFGSAYDTNLYRLQAGNLKSDGTIHAGQYFVAGQHVFIRADSGRVYFGANDDASLYRPSASKLKTDGVLAAGATLETVIGDSAGVPAIVFGADTQLYRAGAGVLKTDSKLVVNNLLRLPWEAPTGLGAVIGKIRVADVDETQSAYIPIYSTV